MAQGRDQITVDVLGNTRPLEKSISQSANKAFVLNTKGFSQPLGKISGQLGEFEKSLAASNARVIAFGASAGAIYAVEKAFNATIKSVIEVEKALTDINVILNVSQKTLSNFGDKLFDIAKNTGLSFAEVARAATEFSRQGLGIEDTLKRTSDALILTRLSGLDTVSSVEALTAAINSFSNSALNSTDIVNKLAAVDASFAVSSADLAEAIKRVGSSAEDVGVSFDQLIGLVTSAQQITSRGGSVIGNSLKTIFTRLQRPKTLDALEEIGVVTKDQENNILPLIQILNNLAQTYDRLGSTQRAQIAETVGGVFQINVLKATLGDLSKEYSIYQRALEISSGATDEAARRNEALNQTLSATINKTLVNLQNAATDIGNLALAPAIQKALAGVNAVLENFGTDKGESAGAKIGEGLATGLGNFLSGPGLLLGAASIVKIFERLTVFTADAFKQLTGLNTQSAEQRTIQSQILTLISKNPQIIEQINSGNVNTASLHTEILTLIEQETIAMQKQVAVAESLTKSLMASGVGVAQSGALRGTVIKNKAFGFIPNFSANQEVMGALSGGYMPGNIKKTFIPNYGQVTYNGAETVKKFPGMKQSAIMPPSNSMAGKRYRENFQAAHGFNPYSFGGFIPNFAINDPLVEKGYVKITGQLQDIATRGKAGSVSKIGKALGVINGPADSQGRLTHYVPAQNYEKLINASKKDFEKSAIARGAKFEGKREPYALIYPSFTQSERFLSAGTSGGKTVGFDVVPFPGNIQGKQNKIIGPDLYKKSLNSLVENASEFLVSLAGVDPKLVNNQKFKNYLYSNITQDQIGSLVGNAFEGGILASLNIVPEDRSRVLDLSKEELKILGKTFKISSLIDGSYLGGDFKNAINPSNLDSMAGKIISSKSNKSFGFIPNFSPINRAFKTEKNLGGNPTLDFQPGVGLYVRDKNTQSNFAAVKRDHPEGITTAMSNSYAMQKGMAAFGFVPNFIAAKARKLPARNAKGQFIKQTGDQPLSSAAEAELQQSTSEAAGAMAGYRDKLIFASLGISVAGGFFSELAGENKILQKNINDFSQGLSTAFTAVQLLPGQFGLVAGGLVAAYSAVNALVKTFRDNRESIGQNLEKIKEETSTFSNATGTYSQALQKLTDAYGNAKTPTETIVKLNQDLSKAAMDLPDKYRLQLLSITDNIKLQDEINRIQVGLAKEQKNLEFATAVNAKITEGGIFGTPDVFKSAAGSKSGAREIFGGLNDQGQVKFLKDLNGELFKLNQPELINFLEKYYGLNSDIASVLSGLNAQEFKTIATSLELYGKSIKQAQIEFKNTDALRQEQIKTQSKLAKETQKAKTAVESLNSELINLVNSQIKSQTFRQNFGATQGATNRSIGLSRASSLLDYNQLFQSDQTINAQKGRIESLTRREEFSSQIRDISSASKQSILEIGANLLESLRAPGQEDAQPASKIEAFQSALLNISEENLSASETANEINKNIIDLFGKDFDKGTEAQLKIRDEVRQQNEKLTTLNEEQRKTNSIAELNLAVQKEIARARGDLQVAGGVNAFLNPTEDPFQKFNEFVDIYNKNRNIRPGTIFGSEAGGQDTGQKDFMLGGSSVGRKIARGRGALGILSEIQNFVGGQIDTSKFGNNIKSLRQEAVSGRALDIRSQAQSFKNAVATPLKPIFDDIINRSNNIAGEQIDNLLKTEEIGPNVARITSILEKIAGDQGKGIGLDVNKTISSAVAATQTDLMPAINDMQGKLFKANQVLGYRQDYQNVGEQIGSQNLKRTVSEQQLTNANKQIQNITPELQKSIGGLFPRAGIYDFAGGNEAIIEKEKLARQKLNEGLKSQQPISLKALGLSDKANTNFGLLLEEYNKQISTSQTSRAAIDAATKSLSDLNNQVNNVASNLLLAGQNVTPIGNLAGQQNLQGAVDVNIPNNNLSMNVDGAINFNPGKFEITFAPNSDLTTLVTPVIDEWWAQAQTSIKEEINNRIFKIREEAGLRKEPTPLGAGR
jgi:TP901 family phage tail tape measure protein